MICVNPDDFLGEPRVFTAERNRQAWSACFDLIENALATMAGPVRFYVVCGVQGAGKTRWIRENRSFFAEPAVVVDAALPRARDREGLLRLAHRFSCLVIGVQVRCPLDVALARNRSRPFDRVVPDEVVRLVFQDFEPPGLEEGFHQVIPIATASET